MLKSLLKLNFSLRLTLKSITLLSLNFMLLNIPFSYANNASPPTVSINTQGELNFQGSITFTNYQTLVKLYQDAKIKPTTLFINSLGGDGLAGILLGEFIHQHALKLVITDYCMSSCANFVFTASPDITLEQNTLIVFHGSFNQVNLTEKLTKWFQEELKQKPHSDLQKNNESSINFLKHGEKSLSFKYYPRYQKACSIPGNQQENRTEPNEMASICTQYLRQQESDYFAKVNIEPSISTWGQTGIYEGVYQSYQYIGFYYQLDDLKKLGLKQIHIKDNKAWSPYANPYYSKVYPVALAH